MSGGNVRSPTAITMRPRYCPSLFAHPAHVLFTRGAQADLRLNGQMREGYRTFFPGHLLPLKNTISDIYIPPVRVAR